MSEQSSVNEMCVLVADRFRPCHACAMNDSDRVLQSPVGFGTKLRLAEPPASMVMRANRPQELANCWGKDCVHTGVTDLILAVGAIPGHDLVRHLDTAFEDL